MRWMSAAPAMLALLIAAAPAGGKTTPVDPLPHAPARAQKSTAASALDSGGLTTAYFAGGPFWALEAAFESQPGVQAAIVGYMGTADTIPVPVPAYDEVIGGGTGLFLAVAVRYDSRKLSYRRLADIYWRNIDPLSRDRQFLDSGYQFRTALLYRNPAQKREALASRDRARRRGRFRDSLVVAIEPAGIFLPAEESRQDYHRKHPGRYRAWVRFSGREAGLRRIWGSQDTAKARPRARAWNPADRDSVPEDSGAIGIDSQARPRPPHSTTESQ